MKTKTYSKLVLGLFVLITSVIHVDSFAQIGFQDHIIMDDTTSANGPTSIFSADIDGDGDMDILTASRDDDKVAWYENTDGLGNFGIQQVISTNTDLPLSVFAADIDGDGDMDVLSASYNDNKIAWYENTDGNGSFGTQQVVTTNADMARSVFAIDIDGDNDMDILSASYNDDKIAWYENIDGQGNFGTQQIITTNADGAMSVYAADIDGDSDMDIVSASYKDSKISWYENIDGQGNFSAQQVITTNASGAKSVYTTDMDGDGDMDVISGSSFHIEFVGNMNKILWFENIDGLGNFITHEIYVDTTMEELLTNIYASDIDGDSDIDIVSIYSDKVTWHKNTDGLGNFDTQELITSDIIAGLSVHVNDIDGDNDMDVLSASLYDDKAAWYENTNSLGDFGIQQIIIKSVNYVRYAYATDIDNDGDYDVVSASSYDKKIAWFENTDGQGNFGTQQIISINADGACDVSAADIDGDGDMDILSASFSDDKIAWYENLDGQGNFSIEQIISTEAEGAWNLSVTDIDGDGDMDVISASRYDDKVAWYENTDGLGNFGVQQVITTNALSARSVCSTDLDGDGDVDILSASYDDDKIAWYENTDGLGNFGVQQIITTNADEATCVYATDIDGDGDMDVLSASSKDNKIAWYENIDGQGSFSVQKIITINAYNAQSVFASDMDADGNMDVLSASSNDGKIAWYENTDAHGSFGSQQIITNNEIGAKSVFAIDLDNDTDIDVLTTSSFTTTSSFDRIAWYENTGFIGVSENTLQSQVNVYPNPVATILEIKNSSVSIIKKITIYDILGKVIVIESNHFNYLNLSHLKSGIYFVKLKTERGTITKKIIKE